MSSLLDSIDVIGFLRRRFYRIVPPLVFMVLVCTPFLLLVRTEFISGIKYQIAAALGFVTNYFEIVLGNSYENQFAPHVYLHYLESCPLRCIFMCSGVCAPGCLLA